MIKRLSKEFRHSFVGKKINRLTIIEAIDTPKGKSVVKAICECGKIITCKLSAIISGNTKSCGCMNKERITTHGMTEHPLYRAYKAIMTRCYDKSNKKYKIYGGRGVTMCNEWLNSKESFFNWALSNGWKKGLQIDKDIIPKRLGIPSLVYSPDMCSIVTPKVNNRNKSNSSMITHNGETLCVADWAEKLGISPVTINARIRIGWNRELAITKPIQKYIKSKRK